MALSRSEVDYKLRQQQMQYMKDKGTQAPQEMKDRAPQEMKDRAPQEMKDRAPQEMNDRAPQEMNDQTGGQVTRPNYTPYPQSSSSQGWVQKPGQGAPTAAPPPATGGTGGTTPAGGTGGTGGLLPFNQLQAGQIQTPESVTAEQAKVTSVGPASQATAGQYEATLNKGGVRYDPVTGKAYTYDPVTGEAVTYDPKTQEVDAKALAARQLTGLLSSDSKYINQARQQAREQAATRGLLNSSIAAGAGQRAAIQAGLPIASQDAASHLQQALANQQAINTAGQFNAGQQQNMNLANMQAQNQASQFNAGQSQNMELANMQAQNQAAQFGAAQEQQANLANQAMQNQAAAQNAQMATQVSQFNASQVNEFAKFQAAAAIDVSKFNAALNTDMAKFNASLGFETSKFNTAAANQLLSQKLGIAGTNWLAEQNLPRELKKIAEAGKYQVQAASIHASGSAAAARIGAEASIKRAQIGAETARMQLNGQKEMFTQELNSKMEQIKLSSNLSMENREKEIGLLEAMKTRTMEIENTYNKGLAASAAAANAANNAMVVVGQIQSSETSTKNKEIGSNNTMNQLETVLQIIETGYGVDLPLSYKTATYGALPSTTDTSTAPPPATTTTNTTNSGSNFNLGNRD